MVTRRDGDAVGTCNIAGVPCGEVGQSAVSSMIGSTCGAYAASPSCTVGGVSWSWRGGPDGQPHRTKHHYELKAVR